MSGRIGWVGMVLTALLVGCLPEKRLIWSPDGKWAAVRTGDGLYLCDENGRLSGRIADEVSSVAWFPDSRRLLVQEGQMVKTWDEVASAVPEDTRNRLLELSERLYQEAMAYEGDWDGFEPSVADEVTDGEMAAIRLGAVDRHRERLKLKLGSKWDKVGQVTAEIVSLRVYVVSEGTARPGPIVCCLLSDAGEMRISPTGEHIALIEPLPEEGDARLSVVAVEGGHSPRPVADFVAMFPDWSADGQYLAYARASGRSHDDATRLGSITRRRVCDADHKLLAEFPDPEDLAGVLFCDWLRVRCLGDGRILFTASEVHLPCTPKDMPQDVSLFAVHPGRQATVTRVIPREAKSHHDEKLTFFELSPDESRIAFPGPQDGVVVLTLAAGEAAVLAEGSSFGEKVGTLPVWRTNDELCFMVPAGAEAGSPERAEIVLWSSAGMRCISKDWPPPVAQGLLTEQEGEESDTPDDAEAGPHS
jgi:hypothetical protein